MKKTKVIVIIALGIIMLSTIVYANELKVIDSNDDYKIENQNIEFTKKIVNCNNERQEVEIELCIENIKKDEIETDNTEIILILDNSTSMEEKQATDSRKNITYETVKKLVNSIYNNFEGIELGIVQYSKKANILTKLTSEKSEALNALEKYKNSICQAPTQTEEALKVARNRFSDKCKNKLVILVTDGYPTKLSETKSELLALEKANIKILSAIICEDKNNETIQKVFGTEENPTAGKIYYIPNDLEIDNVLNKLIYSEIINYKKYPIKNIYIKDFFPEYITKYFDIEYSNVPSKGSVTNLTGNYFIWHIDELYKEEKVYFRYKLKLKEDIDITPIINKNLETNETVTIDYEDNTKTRVTEIVEKNPIIKIEICVLVENDDLIENEVEMETEIDNKINVETEQEFVIVDITLEENSKEEHETVQQIQTAQPTPNTNHSTEEKLPQTGNKNTVILITIVILIIIAVKIKLSTMDIYIVKK